MDNYSLWNEAQNGISQIKNRTRVNVLVLERKVFLHHADVEKLNVLMILRVLYLKC